jgi:hypothetical protein
MSRSFCLVFCFCHGSINLDIPDKHRKSKQHSGISEEYSSGCSRPWYAMPQTIYDLTSNFLDRLWMSRTMTQCCSGPYTVSHAISQTNFGYPGLWCNPVLDHIWSHR